MEKKETWQQKKLRETLEFIKSCKPEERLQIDNVLMETIAGDAAKASEDYELVLAENYVEEADALVKNWGKMQGLSTGYPSLDKLTKGLVNGELIIIGGATSNGKTTLAVNITANLMQQGKRVVFVTMEMTRAQLTSRVMYVNPASRNLMKQLAYQKSETFNWQSVDGLIAKAKRAFKADIIIIDHLHHFTRELQNVSEDLGRITKEFQKNAHEHDIPVVVISHTRKGDGMSIDDLRGSSYIAQDSDIVLMVGRNGDEIAVLCEKNRNRGIEPEPDDNAISMEFDKTIIRDYATVAKPTPTPVELSNEDIPETVRNVFFNEPNERAVANGNDGGNNQASSPGTGTGLQRPESSEEPARGTVQSPRQESLLQETGVTETGESGEASRRQFSPGSDATPR